MLETCILVLAFLYLASGPRSLSENPIWLRAACFSTGLRPAASTIYTDIACFAVLASHKTARSRAHDGILRHTHWECLE
jgi:hypothetical protein